MGLFDQSWGCLKSWFLFRHPREFKIKSLYSNDLFLNIASKSKEPIQKLKFLDSPDELLCSSNGLTTSIILRFLYICLMCLPFSAK